MLTTTTSTIENKKVTKYLGIVTGEAVASVKTFKDVFSGIKNLGNGEATNAYEHELKKAQKEALEELKEVAGKIGANAVVGIAFDYEVLTGHDMLMVSINGTAVFVE
jgi:uncharacterized protein YbjQ (UPF0145 family)